MNKTAIRRNLEEAAEQLTATLRAIDKKGYGEAELLVEPSHVYHHLNTAWQGRKVGAKRHRECSEKDFYLWRRFPTEKEMMLDRLPRRKNA